MAKNKTINMVKSQVIYKDYSKDAERTVIVSGENLAHMFGKIARWYTDISWVGHTHTEANITDFGTYAGSSTKGGAATSANKLNIGASDIGSETKPVYFNATTGKPVACAYSLNASVPANAVFTDINVKQSPSTANESREVLFAGNTGNTETTGTVGKSNKLYFNPNTGALTATSFSGSVDASNLTGSIDAGRLPTTSVTAGSYGPAAGGTLAHGGTFDVGYVTVDKYGRLTAASTKTFTLPAQYVHPTYTSKTSGLYKITVDGTGHVSGTAAVTAADLPSHSHTLSLATDTGTSSITLSANTKYKLTAGGSTYVFTTPADTNTTYSAGTGLSLDGTTFNLYMPRVTKDCNEALPGINKVKFEEYSNSSTNTPSAQWYHITTMEGEDTRYATQLALGMTTTRLFYRNYSSSTWSAWKEVSFSDHTHNYAGSPTPGGDANRALQSNNCKVDVTNASTSTTYGVVFVKDPETTEDNTLRKTNDFRINHFRGVANTEGITELVLGNNVAKTGTNNSSGHISLYNSNGKYTEIVPNTGSSVITITLPSSAGTLALVGDNNHTHNYIPNTQAGLISAINLLSTGESTPTDNDYYIAQYAGGGTTTTSYHRRLHSALWSYINGKISYSNTGSGNAVTSISYSNGVITATKGSTFASSTHSHGTLYSSFVSTLDTTTNTWAAAGLNGEGHVIKSIRTNTNAPAYLLNDFSAGIGFGGADTRGVISVKYNTPIIRFAGGNRTATDGGTATWYFTLAATSAQTYTLPSSGGTLTDIIYKASNYYAAASHTHSEYLPLSGGNMTGDLSFASVTSTEYPAVSKQISFGGSTDGGQIFFEVTASDKGCLVLQTTDDPDAKIIFRNKVTSGGTRANEVTITDGVIAGNGSGLTNLNASNISSGTIAAARLPAAYLPLTGDTMSGLIKGGRGYTHLALGVDSYTNDYGGLDKLNNVDINTWYGFSVSNACTTVGTLNQVAFSVNARTGNVYARTGIYVGGTKVSLEGHTHNYVPNTKAGVSAAITLLDVGDDTPVDNCYYITQTNDASSNTYYRRKHSSLWTYIKGKADSVYSAIGHTHSSITGPNKHDAAVPTSTVGAGVLTIFYNVDNASGNMPKSNNANAIIQLSKHSGEYDSQLGFSSDGNIYYRSASGSAFTTSSPWKQLAWKDDRLGANSDGSYWGMASPSNDSSVWIRTTSLGIIPYQSGAAGSGHQSIGTSSWYFSAAYIDTVHGSLDGKSTYTDYINIVATNEIRFNVKSKPSSAMDIHIGHAWSDGTKDAKINRYIFKNGNAALTKVQASTFEATSVEASSSVRIGTSSAQGTITLYNNSNKSFSIVASPDAAAGGGITLPPTGGLMTDIVYKASSGTYGALGKVENTGCIASLTAEGISSHTSRASSTQSFGGTYTIGSTWYNMLSIRHRNGASDGGSYGFYLRNSLTSSSSLVYNQQYNGSSWRGEATIVDSLNLSSYAVPNTADGLSTCINKLSTGTSTPSDNDYYVAQYAAGGTSVTSYHRRLHSALFSYINSKLYKILWSGSTSCTARSSTSITLTTAISANKYRFIKVVWNCGTYTGTSEFRADTLNVTNNIPSGSDATTTNMIQFKIASDGKSVSVGPGTTTITVIQIAGVYPL